MAPPTPARIAKTRGAEITPPPARPAGLLTKSNPSPKPANDVRSNKESGKRKRELEAELDDENMAMLISDYVKAEKSKLARNKSDDNQQLTRITWENAHTFFGRENEFPLSHTRAGDRR